MKNDIIPKKRCHKNVSIGFELVLPRNNVFSQKYIYDKCISLKILLCLAVLWQSVTVCENHQKNIIFLISYICIWIFTLELDKITPVPAHVYFWRKNSNIFHLKINTARLAQMVWYETFGVIFKHCVSLSLVGHSWFEAMFFAQDMTFLESRAIKKSRFALL